MNFLFTYLRRLTFLLLIYTSSRVYFYLNNIDSFINSFDNATLIEFIEGWRFDISALVYINIPLLVLLLFPTNLRKKNGFIRFTNILFYAVNIPFIILNNIDIEYFRFTQKRSTVDFFQLLQLGEDAKNIIPQYIKDYWLITLFTIIQVWFLLKIKHIPKTTIALNAKSILSGIFIFIIGGGIFILGARGGLQLKPIKPINAGELSGSQNTALILNTPFCILHSLDDKPLETYNYFKPKKLNQIYSPIHLHIKDLRQGITKKNIVILIMESYSKEFVGFYNNGIGYTPFLDSLMQHSLVFTNAYANGLKSIEALPAITASIPSLMDNPLITSSYAQNNFESMASLLNKEGYNTSFYHGGMKGTMGFYSFSKKAGFTDYFGMQEYNNADDFDGTWGVYDGPFMQYFANGLNGKKEPFFSTVFSSS
ncbi:MAG: LTA synthase family protein, partial [Cryomorphaceae bacterium]|nr:LTA synthase family protein [Cryomorphaceae bacterium]